MRDLIRRWIGLDETDEDTCEAIARLHLRTQQLEQEVRRLDAVVAQLAKRGHDMSELERRRFMRGWVQRNDPTGNPGLDA